jgi:hypothetical protein
MAKIVFNNCRVSIWTTRKMDDGDNYKLRVEDKDGVVFEEEGEIVWRYMLDHLAAWKGQLAAQQNERMDGEIAASKAMQDALTRAKPGTSGPEGK